MPNAAGMTWTRGYEAHRNLLSAVENRNGTNLLSRYDYANDALGRRTARQDRFEFPVSSFVQNSFDYNEHSELTSALMGTNVYAYDFDPPRLRPKASARHVGNRRSASRLEAAAAVTNLYASNPLNQYTSILRASAPPRETLPTHDADGNMTFLPSDAGEGWHCQWDGENRLASASNAAVNARYSYDYMSHRSQKIVGATTNTYLYEGWNLISERITDHGSLITNTYTWGPDLSGSLQGAGGIGGLLSVTHAGATYFPCSDANGNITDYVDTNGTVVAHRDFDAFGNAILATGTLVHDLHFWFSANSFTGLCS